MCPSFFEFSSYLFLPHHFYWVFPPYVLYLRLHLAPYGWPRGFFFYHVSCFNLGMCNLAALNDLFSSFFFFFLSNIILNWIGNPIECLIPVGISVFKQTRNILWSFYCCKFSGVWGLSSILCVHVLLQLKPFLHWFGKCRIKNMSMDIAAKHATVCTNSITLTCCCYKFSQFCLDLFAFNICSSYH